MPGRRAATPTKPRHTKRRIIAIAIVVALLAIAGIGWAVFGSRIMDRINGPDDYSGSGTGEVVVRVEPGANGQAIAQTLHEHDVIASTRAFTNLLNADPSIQIQSGSFRLAEQMSAQAALDALLDPANKVEIRVTVPEGLMIQQVYARLAEASGIDQAEFLRAGGDIAPYALPPGAISLEGWLFPATYTFDDGADAQSILQTMVNRMKQALAQHGVAEADQARTLTFASLIQREAGPAENFPRVARVFQNRLDIGMLLQSDATVAYGTGNTHVVTTTQAERSDASNPYNTYIHPGLPIGPIGAAGDAAITAALQPAEGSWLFFVTVNLETGETVFSNTLAEHNVAVRQFQEWYRAHPEYQG